MKNSTGVFSRSLKSYARVVSSIVIIHIILLLCGYLFYDSYQKHIPVSDKFLEKWIGMLILSCIMLYVLLGIGIKELVKFFKMTQPISFSETGFSIGKEFFSFSKVKEVKTISLTDIYYSYYYGATIVFENGESRFILGEQYYKDETILFKTLEYIGQQDNYLDKNVENSRNSDFDEDHYDFNLYTSIDHILFVLICIVSLFGVLKHIDSIFCLLFLAVFFVLYYLTSRSSYHFIITTDTIEVRNKMLFGYSKTYNLQDIKGVVIYRKGVGKGARYGIRIILHDYMSRFFASNALRTEKWNEMGRSLVDKGIYVVNQWIKL